MCSSYQSVSETLPKGMNKKTKKIPAKTICTFARLHIDGLPVPDQS